MQSIRFLKQISFKRKLLMYSLLLSVIPVTLLGLISSYLAGSSVQEEVDRNHRIILKQIEYQMDGILKSLEASSLQIASDRTVEKSVHLGISLDQLEALETTLDMKEIIRQYRSYNGTLFNISLVYNRFNQVYSNHYGMQALTDFPYYELIHFSKPQYTGAMVVPPYTYPQQKEFLLLRPVPVDSPEQEGWLMLHVAPDIIYEVFQSASLGSGRKLLVIDEQGRIVLGSSTKEIGTRLAPTDDLYRFWLNPSSFEGTYTYNQEAYHLSSEKSSFNNWTYVAMTPQSELTAKSDNIRRLTWITVGVLIGLWMLISIIGSRRLYFPIQRLAGKFSDAERGADDLKALDVYLSKVLTTNERLRVQWQEQLPHLKESVLFKLLRGEMTEQEFAAHSAPYHLTLQGSRFYVCALEVDQPVPFRQKYRSKDRSLIMYALSKLIQEICEELRSCVTLTPNPGQVVYILGTEQEDEETWSKVNEMNRLIREKVREYFQYTITVAISDPHPSLATISVGYEQALQLLRYRFLTGGDTIISRELVEGSTAIRQFNCFFANWQRMILSSIAEGEIDRAQEQFSQMMDDVPQFMANMESVLGLIAYLLGEIDQCLHDKGYDLHDWMDDPLYMNIYSASTLEEIRQWFCDELFPAIQRQMEQSRQSRQSILIHRVIDYIHEKFETDLSLQQVADEFQCSPSLISRSFKEEKGVNFVDYLIHYRMTKAKEWLAHSDLSIKEITDRLCYATTQNFSRVFKQSTGIPPGKYREQYRKGHSSDRLHF
ncbi:helix-turn-helix domain-containing protein [Paenibacillus sp. J2TS4]|uniref:helix-turn-helix domain-containing protein n=1 Tax=Paenibacillus sp. J2TS4 TaxID=2807194 RepID=UPI0020BF54ED|nr:helix-turn-helix domain-containing protein [Paenibacillus sp. J2TS4]